MEEDGVVYVTKKLAEPGAVTVNEFTAEGIAQESADILYVITLGSIAEWKSASMQSLPIISISCFSNKLDSTCLCFLTVFST